MDPSSPSPPSEPPPSIRHECAQGVDATEGNHDKSIPVGVTWSKDAHPTPYDVAPDTSYLLWNTCMLPSEDTDLHSISPATILTLLTEDNESRFSTPITRHLLKKQMFRLQADGGANRSVNNNRDMLHVSWDIEEYSIGGIGDGIECTVKRLFHLLCDDGFVLPVTMYYSPMATETVVSPTDIIFSNANKYDSWWQNNNCASGEGSLRFYNSDGLATSTMALKMRNKLWYILQDTALTTLLHRVMHIFVRLAVLFSTICGITTFVTQEHSVPTISTRLRTGTLLEETQSIIFLSCLQLRQDERANQGVQL